MEKTIPATAQSGSFDTLLQAMEFLGMTDLIGEPGEYTAFQTCEDGCYVYHVIPGRFGSDEFLDMVDVLMLPPIVDKDVEPDWDLVPMAA